MAVRVHHVVAQGPRVVTTMLQMPQLNCFLQVLLGRPTLVGHLAAGFHHFRLQQGLCYTDDVADTTWQDAPHYKMLCTQVLGICSVRCLQTLPAISSFSQSSRLKVYSSVGDPRVGDDVGGKFCQIILVVASALYCTREP